MFTFVRVNKRNVGDLVFYYNFVDLCNKIEKSPSAAAEEMGFQRSVVTRWSKGTTPRQATLQKIADYFGVTVEDLTSEKKEKPTTQKGGELSPIRQEVWNLLNSMSDEKLEKALVILRAAAEM